MAVKHIVIWPDPVLKQKAALVSDFGEPLQEVIRDLLDTMISEPMAGLSAPQIGVSKRLFVCAIDPADNNGNGTNGPEVFVNPEIIKKQGSFSWEEGCMSIPGYRGEVTRAHTIVMRYQDKDGNFHEREAFDYLSGCFQHEIDHLDGILWIDYQNIIKKNLIKKKMIQFKKLPLEEQRWQQERK